MRLFVAVELDPDVARRLEALGEELKRRTNRLAPRARVTWIPVDRLHVTVRFVGEADERQTAALTAALQAPLGTEPFELTLAGAGTFPAGGAPRAIWAGIAGGGDALGEIEREVSDRVAGCGVPRDARPYRPHVTLARVRDAAGLRASALLEGIATEALGATRVEAITLFHSRLSPKGPSYEALQRTPLRSG